MTPRFSILIPAHRAGRFLPATLAAVAAQTERDWELLIFEDGCLDDTADLVQKHTAEWPQTVRLLRESTQRGVSHARNALLKIARADWIAFLDADDVWESDFLSTAATSLTAGADIVIAGVTLIDAEGVLIRQVPHPAPRDIADPAPALYRYNFVQCTSALSATGEVLRRVAPFDEMLTHGEDLDLWLRLTWAGARWAQTGRYSCQYRKHGQGAMADPVLVSERLAHFYQKHLHEKRLPRALREECMKGALLNLGRMTWRENPARAADAYLRLFRLLPSLKSWSLWLAARTISLWPFHRLPALLPRGV